MLTLFPALSVYPRIEISRSALETYHQSLMQTKKSLPKGKQIMWEKRLTLFPALSVYPRIEISRSALETYHQSLMQTKKSLPKGKQIMREKRLTLFPALSVDLSTGIFSLNRRLMID